MRGKQGGGDDKHRSGSWSGGGDFGGAFVDFSRNGGKKAGGNPVRLGYKD